MRYAIVSDIHANFPAWEAVLADFRECKIEEVVCLGDVVGYGPKPAEVLEAVRAVTGNFVMGNHDAAAVGMMDYSIFNDHAREAIEWTMGQLDEAGKEFLSSVPLAIEAGNILFVHAEIEEPGRFGYISDLEVAQRNLEAGKHFVTFIGHTHLPKVFEMDIFGEVSEFTDGDITLDSDSRYIVNVGSVGEPRNPEDLRARYVIYDTETQKLEFRRVEFDIPAYRKDLEATTLSMRPFFLRTYEFTVEGREVVVSQGGSLMDMRVGRGSVSLISSGQVARMGQLTGTHPVLASAKPSKAPKIISAVAAVLVICFGLYLYMDEPKEAPVVRNDKAAEGKDLKKERAGKVARAKETPKRDVPESKAPEVESDPVIRTPEAPMKADAPDPSGEKVVAAKVDTPKSAPEPSKQKSVEPVEAWWRMDGASANTSLVAVGKKFPLEVETPGEEFRLLAPKTIPGTKENNPSSLKIGFWQEAKPSGQFSLNSRKSFTFEGWFLAGKLKVPAFLVGTRPKAGKGWGIWLNGDWSGEKPGKIFFGYDTGKKFTHAIVNKGPVADGKEHHFAAVWDHDQDDDEGQMRLYLDGVLVADEMLPHASLSNEQPSRLSVGAEGKPRGLALDELRYSQEALAPPEFLSRSVAGRKMIKGGANKRDSWMSGENWVGGEVPKGEQKVIIGAGITAQVEHKMPRKFTGSLILENKAKVFLWDDKAHSVMLQNPAKLEMHQDSQFRICSGQAAVFGLVELHADAQIWGGDLTRGHGMERKFSKPITGSGKLIINGVKKNNFIFEAKNTFDGGFAARPTTDDDFTVTVRKSGNLGKGDVWIGKNCTLIIGKDTVGVIENDKTLFLEVKGLKKDPQIRLNSDETVGAFVVNGKNMGVGPFSRTTHPKFIGGYKTLKIERRK
ncbi:metallophosphoesterase family protein [Akkermansiaceae bacterium]|nr:metallophosphoesterase family protein [Akkermansiaceae bacterium]MDB4734746.1 metallophosphoesterase family protein [Akkermansiaceae bacterium]